MCRTKVVNVYVLTCKSIPVKVEAYVSTLVLMYTRASYHIASNHYVKLTRVQESRFFRKSSDLVFAPPLTLMWKVYPMFSKLYRQIKNNLHIEDVEGYMLYRKACIQLLANYMLDGIKRNVHLMRTKNIFRIKIGNKKRFDTGYIA